MTPNEFQMRALSTLKTAPGNEIRALCALGLSGEAGEVLEGAAFLAIAATGVTDELKKHLFHGKTLDVEHVAYEIGDVLWYAAVLAHSLGYELEQVMEMNIEKLRLRNAAKAAGQ